MSEPTTKADAITRLLPWLAHWTIVDERLGESRSDAYAVATPDGTVGIDVLPLTRAARAELGDVCALFLTHRNHQRSAWRFRRELGAPVYAPAGTQGLDEEPDVLMDEATPLPGGLHAIRARGFRDACYLTFAHEDGTGVLFAGDLICHDPDGPYRFPVQPDYFDLTGGQADARRLLELPLDALCAAHASPTLDGCRAALEEALQDAELRR